MYSTLFKILLCLFGAGFTLYISIGEQNRLMNLRRAIPPIDKEVRALEEENHRLQYMIDRFEDPAHLLELLREPRYGHLRYPLEEEVIVLPKALSP